MNQPPKGLQDLVHSLESGAARRWIRNLLVGLVVVVIAAGYLLTEARDFSNPEAMEMAQVGRNLATGHGFTTHFIRPLGLRLLQERAVERGLPPSGHPAVAADYGVTRIAVSVFCCSDPLLIVSSMM